MRKHALIWVMALAAASRCWPRFRPRRSRRSRTSWSSGVTTSASSTSAPTTGHDGLQDAEHRPHRERRRAVHRLVRPAELHGRPRRVRHRAVADPHRPHQGRTARRARGHEGAGPHHRHAAQGAGLHDRAVRQEPLGDRTRCCRPTTASTSSLATSTTSTRRRSREPGLSDEPEFKKRFGPRGVIHSFADGRINDTGPLTRKRMETIDEEVNAKALDFMTRAKQANKPFFIWWNSTRMHIWTHLKPESKGKTGLGCTRWHGRARRTRRPGAGEAEELGLEDNTIVMYSTDNGAETMSWPDGGTTMFRARRTPTGKRLPRADDDQVAGVIKPARSSTTSERTRTCCRRCWPRPATPPSRRRC